MDLKNIIDKLLCECFGGRCTLSVYFPFDIEMKINFVILFLLVTSLLMAQEKKDSMIQFFKFYKPQNAYVKDFEVRYTSDSLVYHVLDSIQKIGYYTVSLDSVNGNSYFLNKGNMYKKIWIKNDSLFQQKTDWIAVQDLDSLIQNLNERYASKGFPFVETQINPLGFRDGEAQIEIRVKPFQRRSIDGVAVEGYEKLSKGYIKHGLNLKNGKLYNESELKEISERLSYNPYIEEVRSPQTLFNTDSTTIYLYVKKIKSNLFDGLVGFGNDSKGDFRLNGNVKVELNNNFNSMEKIRLNWIATADKSSTLDLQVRVPYLFRSAIGTESNFNLYRKDSVFVNTKFEERLFYQTTLNSTIGLNLSFEGSNFVLEDELQYAGLYDDFNKTGIGLSYDYQMPSHNRLLEGKMAFFLLGKTLKREGQDRDPITEERTDTKTNQYEVGFKAYRIFTLYPKHLIKTKLEGFGLFSNGTYYSANELYRIGGFGSIRGFNEESISASAYGIASLEYRFLPNDGFYISLFGDYGFVENQSIDIHENLLGVGTGISFLTSLGVFNLSYAVGKQSDLPFDFKNSKIHFGILTQF